MKPGFTVYEAGHANGNQPTGCRRCGLVPTNARGFCVLCERARKAEEVVRWNRWWARRWARYRGRQ